MRIYIYNEQAPSSVPGGNEQVTPAMPYVSVAPSGYIEPSSALTSDIPHVNRCGGIELVAL